jgi:hypothetical protein
MGVVGQQDEGVIEGHPVLGRGGQVTSVGAELSGSGDRPQASRDLLLAPWPSRCLVRRDSAERRENAHRLHSLAAALGWAMSRAYLPEGAVDLHLPPVGPETRLAGLGHVAGSDLAPDPPVKSSRSPAATSGSGDRAGRQRHAEELWQSLRGPLLRQELPSARLMVAVTRLPYCTGHPPAAGRRPWCDARRCTPAR